MRGRCYAIAARLTVAVALAPGRFACRAGLLVPYRPLAHVRFREETEPVDGEARPLILLRAAEGTCGLTTSSVAKSLSLEASS